MGTIDDYLADLDPASRDAIEHVYAVARTVVPDAEQGKGYGMPALVYRGKSLIAVMRAKTHIGVYPFSADVVAAVAPQFAGFSLDKGTIRFQPDEPLPDEAVVQLVELRRAQIDAAGKAPATKAPAPPG
ncbi:iron chaperone [Microbacterium sp. DT81.1]|uniref:iron chaperone n=1 Tax=Microbacterium sp. DT81.1 TaxID=3393413 RepID=UPI003CEDA635